MISSDSLTFPKKVMRIPSSVIGTATALSCGSTAPGVSATRPSRFAKIEETSAKPRKNAIASGVTMKWAKDAPRRNMIGDAMINGKNADFSDL